ncbi:MAG: hypothetical protein L6Q59_02290 [Ignavibacteriaceae bacterium]|nr:hypothetical protein [Ignavibacteriaceae bacterium]
MRIKVQTEFFTAQMTTRMGGDTTGHHSTIMILQRDISNLILGGIF